MTSSERAFFITLAIGIAFPPILVIPALMIVGWAILELTTT